MSDQSENEPLKAVLYDAWCYVCAVLSHWIALTTGGFMMASVWFARDVKGYALPDWTNVALAHVFVGLAAFMAWRDMKKKRDALTEDGGQWDTIKALYDEGARLRSKWVNEKAANIDDVRAWVARTKAYSRTNLSLEDVRDFEMPQSLDAFVKLPNLLDSTPEVEELGQTLHRYVSALRRLKGTNPTYNQLLTRI